MKIYYLGAALALGGLGIFGGCAKSGQGTGSTSGSSTTSGTASSGTKLKLVYIPKNTGNSYFDPVIDGFKKASAEKGFDFSTAAPAHHCEASVKVA